MKQKIKFGTDGWRGLLGEELNTTNICRVAQAFADYIIKKGKNKKVTIGYDGRIRSNAFAREFAEVLYGNKIEVMLSDQIIPTPVVSFSCIYDKCDAGVMITASHNTPDYNGIKFKTDIGSPFPTEETAIIESLIDKNPVQKLSHNINKANLLYNYLKHIEKIIDFQSIRDAGFFIAIDSMAGAGRTILEDILVSNGITAKTIYCQATPNFSGRIPEPISKNLKPLEDFLRTMSFSIGLATDGDADRIGILTESGKWLNIQECILWLAEYYINKKNTHNTIIKSASVTNTVSNIKSKKKINIIDVPVGFKYIAEAMIDNNAAFGAEESGGFGFQEHMPDRDGIFSALMFLEMLSKSGHNKLESFCSQKHSEYGRIFYDRVDMIYEHKDRNKILPALSTTPPDAVAGFRINQTTKYTNSRGRVNGLKLICETNTRWLLIRVSETEPVVRIYAEGECSNEVVELLTAGQKLMNLR